MDYVNDWKEVISMRIIEKENHRWGVDELEIILSKSIEVCAKKCLRDNSGKIYTTLSGGLDSSFCLAVLRRIIDPGVAIHTFTIGGSERHPDIQFARQISRQFKSIHHEFIPTIQEIEKARNELAILNEEGIENLGVLLIYKFISGFHPYSVIVHDGVDELLGGYWEHRAPREKLEKVRVFEDFWHKLEGNHLLPLERKAERFNISLIFPYLQKKVVEYISRIPIEARTTHENSKVPLRDIAERYLPSEVIRREKKGFNAAMER